MRLRQIALASSDLEAVTRGLAAAFDLEVAYNDPGVAHYGLRNAVMSAGDGFLEVVQPVAADASAGRFIRKRGGDAGYMVIIQVLDAEAERARMTALGAQVVDDIDTKGYRASHFHPAAFGGMLVSVDQQRDASDLQDPLGPWWPAGPTWREHLSDEVTALLALEMASEDPDGLAALWSRLLARPLASGDARRLPLDRGEIRFVSGEGPFTQIRTIELGVKDAGQALARARSAGLDVDAALGVRLGGVWFRPKS